MNKKHLALIASLAVTAPLCAEVQEVRIEASIQKCHSITDHLKDLNLSQNAVRAGLLGVMASCLHMFITGKPQCEGVRGGSFAGIMTTVFAYCCQEEFFAHLKKDYQ